MDATRSRQPERIVELAFLERMSPTFEEAVTALSQRGVTEITVAPIFLAMGGHMRKDLPNIIADSQQETGITFQVLPALGEVEVLLNAIADWLASTAA